MDFISFYKKHLNYQTKWIHYLWVQDEISLTIPHLQIIPISQFTKEVRVLKQAKLISKELAIEYLKWLILKQHGGVYFDFGYDLYSGNSILDLHHCSQFYTQSINPKQLGFGIVGSKAKHPLTLEIEESLRQLILNFQERPHFCSKKNDLKAIRIEAILFEWMEYHLTKDKAGSVLLEAESETRTVGGISQTDQNARVYNKLVSYCQKPKLNQVKLPSLVLIGSLTELVQLCRNSLSRSHCYFTSALYKLAAELLHCLASCSSISLIHSFQQLTYQIYHQGGLLIKPSYSSALLPFLKIIFNASFVGFASIPELKFEITLAAAPKHPILKELNQFLKKDNSLEISTALRQIYFKTSQPLSIILPAFVLSGSNNNSPASEAYLELFRATNNCSADE